MRRPGRLDMRRAWRFVGVFAPVSLLMMVPLVLTYTIDGTLGTALAILLLPVAVAAATWGTFSGAMWLTRLGAAAAAPVVTALAMALVVLVVGPALGRVGGAAAAVVPWALVVVPWAVLVVGGTAAARAGRYEGAARVTIWWILAVGACGFSVPAVMLVQAADATSVSLVEALFLIPLMAMCLWLGPLSAVGVAALAARRRPPTPVEEGSAS